ncbi:restriction endonuclease subunit S [Aphanizomenon flos-aquae]|uniref:Restriction endonuclease subunit S n=1 Tax=Aphanizomenon flos-aquae FACHB-1040 TaxID=2692887 RepID=A0ABR8BZ26_APHFL|nr:restriction endonuclease subunit S [Aphanizomenon flos-aquae]MBD2278962.1 restriction endonuclease subunit S [Aphanizomenon flos-aquae FACHB-1040]
MSNPIVRLEDLVHIYQGVTLKRYENELGSQEHIINSRNLEQIYISGELSTSQLDSSNLSKYRLQADDVVITIRGTPLKASVVKDEVKGCLPNQNLAILRPAKNLNPVFLAVLMRSKWLETQISGLYSSSIGTQLLKISQLRELEIPLPSWDRQNQLAQLFLSAEDYTKITLDALEIRNNLTQLIFSKIIEGEK